MFLEKPNDKDLKQISLDEFEESLMKHVQPERLTPGDIRNNVCDSPTSENK